MNKQQLYRIRLMRYGDPEITFYDGCARTVAEAERDIRAELPKTFSDVDSFYRIVRERLEDIGFFQYSPKIKDIVF